MLGPVLGPSDNKERVLIYILSKGQGYARELARFFDVDLRGIQNQLENLEAGGVLVSQSVGRTRPYSFNPRYPFLDELKALLEKALQFYPEQTRQELLLDRRRPRRKGKPL